MKRLELILLIASVFLLIEGQSASADQKEMPSQSEWGYDGYPDNSSLKWNRQNSPSNSGNRQENRTGLMPLEPAPVKGMSAKALSGEWAAPKGSRPPSKQLSDLSQFFELAALHSLSPDQRQDLQLLLPSATRERADNDWEKISAFMPEVQERIEQHSQEAEDFGNLFRALLRLICSSQFLPKSQIAIIENILGPARLAVDGTPSLSEEALNSYCDMACFMYEQKNPGKTVDADDNRLVFSHVIKDKFQEAPSAKDKLAMANFALTWYKFKVSYDVAPSNERTRLVQSLDERKGLAKTPASSLTAKIFANGPWRSLFN